jgi:hypothetical protein
LHFQGVNFNSEDLLRDPTPVKTANEFGLVSFVWGEDLDSKAHMQYFKKDLGVDGIIYDRFVFAFYHNCVHHYHFYHNCIRVLIAAKKRMIMWGRGHDSKIAGFVTCNEKLALKRRVHTVVRSLIFVLSSTLKNSLRLSLHHKRST